MDKKYEDFEIKSREDWFTKWKNNKDFRDCCYKKAIELIDKNIDKNFRDIRIILEENKILGPFQFVWKDKIIRDEVILSDQNYRPYKEYITMMFYARADKYDLFNINNPTDYIINKQHNKFFEDYVFRRSVEIIKENLTKPFGEIREIMSKEGIPRSFQFSWKGKVITNNMVLANTSFHPEKDVINIMEMRV